MVTAKHILNHFKAVDPVLFSCATRLPIAPLVARKHSEYFVSLCREIIGQQLSGRVTEVLFSRFERLFPNNHVSPEAVLKVSEEKLRSTGMSWSKTRFIKDLAQQIVDKTIDFSSLESLSEEEVVSDLTKIKGIGPWTAEMFLMFTLGRPDIFSHGDLGLRNAIKKLYGFKKDPSRKTIERLSQKWSPYRTYACLILWKSLET